MNIKKLLSILLCVVLTVALCVPALPVLADNEDTEAEEIPSGEVAIELFAQGQPIEPFAVDLAPVVADVICPAAAPRYNVSFAGAPAGFPPYAVPEKVNLQAPEGAYIFYNIAVVPVSNGVAPTNAQITAVADPTTASTPYTTAISLSDIDENNAVIIKAMAWAFPSSTSEILTLVYFQRLWVLVDVKTPIAGYSQEDWNELVINKVLDEMTAAEFRSIANMNQTPAASRINSSIVWRTTMIDRLCIPNTEMSDGPGGVRTGRTSTCWVTAMGIASTWNVDAMYDFANANAVECKYFATDMILAPAFDLCRSPLGGRNFEYYSEDAVLSGYMATAYTKGMQQNGVGVQLKHYVANDQENGRQGMNVIASERSLRENGILAFEMAIKEGGAWGIMGCYNRVNGIYGCQNIWMMQSLLRDEYGWDGVNVNDYGATSGIQGYAAGSHIATGSTHTVDTWLNATGISNAERDARLARAKENTRFILKYVIKTPNFNEVFNGLTSTDMTNRSNSFNTAETSPFWTSKPVNEMLGAESTTLFKNNGALPLKTSANNKLKIVVVTGSAAGSSARPTAATSSVTNGYMVLEGGGSGDVTYGSQNFVNLLEGLELANFEVIYHVLDNATSPTVNKVSAASLEAAVAQADVVLQTFARTSSEGSDLSSSQFNLNSNEIDRLNRLSEACQAKGIPHIGMLNLGGLMQTDLILQKCDAVFDVYCVGFFGATNIGKVLNGEVNPSGKTTCSWPVTYNDTVPMIAGAGGLHPTQTWNTAGASGQCYYDEDTLMGYKYFITKGLEDHVQIPFGFGLSYTSFEFSNLKLSNPMFPDDEDATITATVTVKNTGTVAGKEVAELYIGADSFAMEGRPIRELKTFAKTKLLQPGESQDLVLTIKWRDLAYYNDGTDDPSTPVWDGWTAAKVNGAFSVANDSVVTPSTLVDNNYKKMYDLYRKNIYAATPIVADGLKPISGYSVDGVDGCGWTVNTGTTFTAYIGGSSATADLKANGVSAEFSYGEVTSISAPAVWNTDEDDILSYDISVARVVGANVIEIVAKFDARLTYFGNVPASGFSVLSSTCNPATGEYKATIVYPKNGAVFSTEDFAKILTVSFTGKPEYNAQLEGALVSATFDKPNQDTSNPNLFAPGNVFTLVDNFMRWNINKDEELNNKDLSDIIFYFYLAMKGDANWESAKLYDANKDNKVDLLDLMIIFSFYS